LEKPPKKGLLLTLLSQIPGIKKPNFSNTGINSLKKKISKGPPLPPKRGPNKINSPNTPLRKGKTFFPGIFLKKNPKD